MNNNPTNKKLLPKLRFPEFENDGEWEDIFLGDKEVLIIVNDKTTIEKLNLNTYLSTENILQDFQGIKKSTKLPQSGSFTKFSKGDILMANIRPYLKKIWFAEYHGAASNDIIVFRAKQKASKQYLKHILKNDKFINFVMIAAKGVKMPRGDKEQILKYPIALPNSKEQQKIADCLSSLDAIIEASNEKLNLLKTHKKGLLQQLFPAEGEKAPKLRFPEFKEDDDWEELELGKALKAESSNVAKNKLNFLENGFSVYGADGKIGYIKNYEQENEYIAIVKDGSGVGNLFFYEGKSSVLGTLTYLLSKDVKFYNLKWFYYLLLTISFVPFVKGSGIPHIYYKDYSKRLIQIPNPKEQQKIADCLTSIDNEIEGQTNKIEILKLHKKGLMQQLFPTLNEEA